MATPLKKLFRFHPYLTKRRSKMASPAPTCTKLPHTPGPVTPLAPRLEGSDSLTRLFGVTPLAAPVALSPIAIRRSDTPKMASDGGKVKGHCCKWEAERRILRRKSQEVLESTRVSFQDSALMDLSAMLDCSVSQTATTANRRNSTAIGEISWRSKGNTGSKMSQEYKGQLDLSIYNNAGLLTVHVVRGRHYQTPDGLPLDTFVQVSLLPADDQAVVCRTQIVLNAARPNYDEKMSFELLPEDFNKRLLISTFLQNYTTGQPDLVGCMSFSVKKFSENSKTVSGWYYLLAESVGSRKHFLVTSQRWEEDEEPQRPRVAGVTNSRVVYKPHVIAMRRGSSGFGFTLNSDNGGPVRISRVTLGGPADKAGLKPGDVITRINREKVYTASVEGLVRIIKHCSRRLLLEVQRPHSTVSSRSPAPLPWPPAYSDLDLSACSSSDDEEEEERSFCSRWGDRGDDKENCSLVYQGFSRLPENRLRFKDFH